MRWVMLAVLLLGCEDERPPGCPAAPDGGYEPGDKIVDCTDRFPDAQKPIKMSIELRSAGMLNQR